MKKSVCVVMRMIDEDDGWKREGLKRRKTF